MQERSAADAFVLTAEGAAVHTALVGGFLLMRRDVYAVEGAVILLAVVVTAVAHRAAYRVICYLFIKHIYHLNID